MSEYKLLPDGSVVPIIDAPSNVNSNGPGAEGNRQDEKEAGSLALQPVEPPIAAAQKPEGASLGSPDPGSTTSDAAAPAQPADRAEPAPLTDAQIEALWDQTFDQPLPLPDKSTIRAKHRRCLFARAILAAGKP